MNETAVYARRDTFQETVPWIRREGIEWNGGVGDSPLELCLTFENPGPTPTAPVPAEVRIAAFGAFLPWRPLTTVTVPAIPPRRRIVVTATAAGFRPPWSDDAETSARVTRPMLRTLPAQTLLGRFYQNLVGFTQPTHLAANIDVRVGHHRPVERHMGRIACLRPGYANAVFFKIGDGQADTYTLTVPKRPPEWEVRTAMPGATGTDAELRAGISIEMTYGNIVTVISAPRKATSGRVVFGIARASCGRSTTVELDLEKAGP